MISTKCMSVCGFEQKCAVWHSTELNVRVFAERYSHRTLRAILPERIGVDGQFRRCCQSSRCVSLVLLNVLVNFDETMAAPLCIDSFCLREITYFD